MFIQPVCIDLLLEYGQAGHPLADTLKEQAAQLRSTSDPDHTALGACLPFSFVMAPFSSPGRECLPSLLVDAVWICLRILSCFQGQPWK